MLPVQTSVLVWLRSYTTFSERSDYFRLYRMLAALSAIHYDSRHRIVKILWTVYRILPLLVNVSYFYKTYRLMFYPKNTTDTAAVVASVWGFTSGTLRIMIIETRYGALTRIMSFLNDRSYRHGESAVHRQRANLFRANNRVLLVLVATMLGQTLWFMTTQLFAREAFMLQIDGRVVSNVAVQIAYGLLSNVWGLIYVLSFALFYIIMNTFRLEMALLLEAIANLETVVLKQSNPLLVPPAGATSHHHRKLFWSTLQQELYKNIARHVQLLDHLRELSSIIGPFSFIQYYGTFALVADCAFIISIEGLSANGVIYVLFAIVLVFESFLICLGIEKINDLNEAIGQALYAGFNWPGLLQYSAPFRRQYQSVRHALLLTIGRSQKGFQCSYGGLGGISMDRFAQLMQKSYSLLTILLQLAK